MKELTLTKAEEQVMQIMWQIEKGFIHDILDKMSAPKPSYTTVSTVVRILEKKNFIGYKAYGKTHEYFPLITKDTYAKANANKLLKNYFDGSFEKLLSFFAKENNVNISDLDEALKMIGKQAKKK